MYINTADLRDVFGLSAPQLSHVTRISVLRSCLMVNGTENGRKRYYSWEQIEGYLPTIFAATGAQMQELEARLIEEPR